MGDYNASGHGIEPDDDPLREESPKNDDPSIIEIRREDEDPSSPRPYVVIKLQHIIDVKARKRALMKMNKSQLRWKCHELEIEIELCKPMKRAELEALLMNHNGPLTPRLLIEDEIPR